MSGGIVGGSSALSEQYELSDRLCGQTGDADRDGLVCGNLGLVHSCAHKYIGRGIEYEDLYSAGCVGLVKAAANFDFSRGLRFSTYAVPVILGEIRRLFRDGGSIKVSRTLKETAARLTKIRTALSNKLGREPTIGELSESSGLDSCTVSEALNSMQPLVSLTADDDSEGQNDVAVSGCEESISDRLALNEVISLLNDRERQLITLRYFKGLTQQQTAQVMDITQVKVSRQEKQILLKLRCELLK